MEEFNAIPKIRVVLKIELFNKVICEKQMLKHSKIYEILKVFF